MCLAPASPWEVARSPAVQWTWTPGFGPGERWFESSQDYGGDPTMRERTRDERIAAQDRDDGDPADDVIVREGGQVTHYHERRDCRLVVTAEATRTMTRKAA